MRGNGTFMGWREGHCAQYILYIGAQEMGPGHAGPCRSGLGRDVFPKSVYKVRFAAGKDLCNY